MPTRRECYELKISSFYFNLKEEITATNFSVGTTDISKSIPCLEGRREKNASVNLDEST